MDVDALRDAVLGTLGHARHGALRPAPRGTAARWCCRRSSGSSRRRRDTRWRACWSRSNGAPRPARSSATSAACCWPSSRTSQFALYGTAQLGFPTLTQDHILRVRAGLEARLRLPQQVRARVAGADRGAAVQARAADRRRGAADSGGASTTSSRSRSAASTRRSGRSSRRGCASRRGSARRGIRTSFVDLNLRATSRSPRPACSSGSRRTSRSARAGAGCAPTRTSTSS